MTKDFDERNAEKSRKVCAAMAEVADTGRRKLSERERQILDMWTKYEDGEYVWFGDEVEMQDEIVREVWTFTFDVNAEGRKRLYLNGFEGLFMLPGEHVKRPTPKVLDAGGVEIKVGDTVWHEDGSEWLVEEMNRYGVRCFDGDKRSTFNQKYLTHTRPKVLDADGVPIHKGDTVWFKGKPTEYKVAVVLDGTVYLTYKNRNGDNATATTLTRNLTHIRPDSWERLEVDSAKGVCEYAGAELSGCIDAHDCDTCRFYREPGKREGLICEQRMCLDIVRRAKKLAGVD